MPFDNNWSNLCLHVDSSITDAIKIIEESDSKVCLVVSESENSIELRGTITDGDIRRGILDGISMSSECPKIMNSSPFTVGDELSIADLENLLVKHQFRHLPIVSNRNQLSGLFYSEVATLNSGEGTLFVIMAGGFGTRLKPFTDKIPKPMVEVRGKPMIQHIIERAKASGFYHFALILHHLPESFTSYFGDGSDFGVSIEYIIEETPLGTVGGLSLLDLKNRDFSSVLVTNGDLVSHVDYRDMVQSHLKQNAFATMAIKQHRLTNEFGTVDTSGNLITGFTEKPTVVSNINAGIYVLSTPALGLLERGKKKNMPDLFLDAVSLGRRTTAYYLYEEWSDVGRESDLNQINGK